MECDYVVWSAPVHTHYGRYAQDLRKELLVLGGSEDIRYGYRLAIAQDRHLAAGVRFDARGELERAMVEASGAAAIVRWADLLALRLMDLEGYHEDVSVRRVDMQRTIEVEANVGELIDGLDIADGYNYLRLRSSDRSGIEGAGLYIGSPTSDIRLRVYDKGAQLLSSGQADAVGQRNLLRVELILRRRKARHFWDLASDYPDGKAEDYILSQMIRRVPALETYLLEGRSAPVPPRMLEGREKQTERWLYDAVIPALVRYAAQEPERFNEWREELKRRVQRHPGIAQSRNGEE